MSEILKDKESVEREDDRLMTLLAAMTGNFILRNGVTELSDYYMKELVRKANALVKEIDRQGK